jgi:hypothetical protein
MWSTTSLFFCGPVGCVASSRSMPGIQLVLNLERHITISSPTRTAWRSRGTFLRRRRPWTRGAIIRSEPLPGLTLESIAKPAATPWKEEANLVASVGHRNPIAYVAFDRSQVRRNKRLLRPNAT